MFIQFKGFEKLNATVKESYGYIEANGGNLKGGIVYLDFPSVGATQNIIMASCLLQGDTVIKNAAREPEIVDLQNFLNSMGAKTQGSGTDTIKISGVKNLGAAEHYLIPDRIEAGTHMIAAALTGGDIVKENITI